MSKSVAYYKLTRRERYFARELLICELEDGLLEIAAINPYAGETMYATIQRLRKQNNRLATVIVNELISDKLRCAGKADFPANPL